MKFLYNVKFNLFLIIANYILAVWMFYDWFRFGTSRYAYMCIANVFSATIVAIGLYARESRKFDARDNNKGGL
jgi:hypothetical protein